jgi:PAS domain S-box-containing protein
MADLQPKSEIPLSRPIPPFLLGGGEMGALMRAHDWKATSIGEPDTWPESLRTCVMLLLNAEQPMYIWWGPELLCLYNDAYRRSIGPERHPGSMGRPGREVWSEIWDVIGPQIDHVLAGRGSVSHENALVPITRNGRLEQVYWTYNYNPILDPNAPRGVGGILVICTETTEKVLSAQREVTERRQLAELFEQSPSFMTMLRGPEHRFELANPNYLSLIGNREIIGRTVAEALPETVSQGYLELLDEVFRSGNPYRAVSARYTPQTTPGGAVEQRYLDFVYQPIHDASGAVTGIFVEGVDVTDRTLAEAALHQSEARFRDIADATPVLIWISDINKTCIWFNSRWLAFTGRWIEQEAGYGWIDGIHPDDLDAYVAVYNSSFDRREPYRTEYRRRRFDGEWRTLDASGEPRFIDGEFVGFIGCCLDVTEQRTAARALSESEEQLRLATEAAEVGLWDLDMVTDTLFWPARVKTMFGISAQVPVSMADFYAGLHPEDRAHTVAALTGAMDPVRRALYDVEYRTVGKEDGAVRWVAAKGRGIFRGDQCVRVIGTAIDVTTRKTAEAQLRELNERLEQRVAEALAERAEAEKHIRHTQKIDAIGQLTGGVAHDFNNLLMVISGGLSLLQRSEDIGRQQRIIDQMRQAADRGASLSRQLLAFARRQALKAEPLDLHCLIDGMLEMMDRTLRGNIQVKTKLADDLWPIKVDRTEFELVILNLCVNARDAMPDGGIITICAKNVARLHEHELSGDFVALTVEDTGSGIPPDVLTRVFEPFFTTKEIGKGSGLGLPQVYGFAQQSGGSVKIDSKVGVGTTATLFLPRSDVAPTAPSPENDGLDSSARRRALRGCILLVEDDDGVAVLVAEMLNSLGYRVTRVASARAALGALADDPGIDLVFSDILMPGPMTGVDLAREVRRRRPGAPILLTSGYAGAALKATDVDDIQILFKPYQIGALDAALREALGKSDEALRRYS